MSDDGNQRIGRLRQRVLSTKDHAVGARWSNSAVATSRSLMRTAGEASWQRRRGALVYDRLASLRFDVTDDDLLLGRLALTGPEESAQDLAQAEALLKGYRWPPGQTGHCQIDLEVVNEIGIDGLRRRILDLAAKAEPESTATLESFAQALEGLSKMIENAADAAEARAAVASGNHDSLRQAAADCRHVAHHPPQTFRQGLQLMWMVDLGIMCADRVALVGPGHIDRVLGRFYEADLAAGSLTRESALQLIECLYLLLNDFIPYGLAIPVMVRGRDPAGRDVTNELSYLCLEALRRTRLVYPTVGVCWHEGTPQTLIDLAIDLIAQGYTTPAFFNDTVIQKGLRELHVPPEQACNYINSTCVEITPVGASNVWVASPYFSLCKLLLDEIREQIAGGGIADFEAFFTSYAARLARSVERGVADQDRNRELRRLYGRKPLQSVFTRDCIGRARDIDDGGAVYNWVECSFVGLANFADSLHVIRQEVFENRTLTLEGLMAATDADFVGHEALLRRIAGLPKYGQSCEAVDRLVGRTVELATDLCRRHTVRPDRAPFVPGAFCWVMHERLGRECGATPDGRRAGAPFADGCGPAQGRETRGPTAGILSTTCWDHSSMIGGLAYNMKFSKDLFQTRAEVRKLTDLVLTYLRRGGFETQINVLSKDVLRKAREHPDDYRDLVVRIGGYTDYFVRLGTQMQDELILRTEFDGL